MIENNFVQLMLNLVLLIQVLLMGICVYRVSVGPSPADRLQAIDTLTNVLIGVIVVLSLTTASGFLIDLAIALAAFSFVASIAIARYISEGRMF